MKQIKNGNGNGNVTLHPMRLWKSSADGDVSATARETNQKRLR